MRALWLLIFVGTAGRIIVAFATRGNSFDVDTLMLMRDVLDHNWLDAYGLANANELRWPYPPGFFPWIAFSGWVARLTGLRFDGVIQIAPILADIGIALVVYAFLGHRGMGDRKRLAAVALVMLGPSFAVISGYHVQIDSVAILPALVAVVVWQRDEPNRALVAGLLIGVGGAVKGVPLLTLLAVLPTARSWREAITVCAAAVGVVVATLLPFLAGDFTGTVAALHQYSGLPGIGGISLLVEPELAKIWLNTGPVDPSALTLKLYDLAGFIAVGCLVAVGLVMRLKRTPVLQAAVLVWLTSWFLGINFAFQYMVWGLPFLLLAGRLRTVAGLQALLLVPTVIAYSDRLRDQPLEYVYVPFMLAAWAAFGFLWVRDMRTIRAAPPALR